MQQVAVSSSVGDRENKLIPSAKALGGVVVSNGHSGDVSNRILAQRYRDGLRYPAGGCVYAYQGVGVIRATCFKSPQLRRAGGLLPHQRCNVHARVSSDGSHSAHGVLDIGHRLAGNVYGVKSDALSICSSKIQQAVFWVADNRPKTSAGSVFDGRYAIAIGGQGNDRASDEVRSCGGVCNSVQQWFARSCVAGNAPYRRDHARLAQRGHRAAVGIYADKPGQGHSGVLVGLGVVHADKYSAAGDVLSKGQADDYRAFDLALIDSCYVGPRSQACRVGDAVEIVRRGVIRGGGSDGVDVVAGIERHAGIQSCGLQATHQHGVNIRRNEVAIGFVYGDKRDIEVALAGRGFGVYVQPAGVAGRVGVVVLRENPHLARVVKRQGLDGLQIHAQGCVADGAQVVGVARDKVYRIQMHRAAGCSQGIAQAGCGVHRHVADAAYPDIYPGGGKVRSLVVPQGRLLEICFDGSSAGGVASGVGGFCKLNQLNECPVSSAVTSHPSVNAKSLPRAGGGVSRGNGVDVYPVSGEAHRLCYRRSSDKLHAVGAADAA